MRAQMLAASTDEIVLQGLPGLQAMPDEYVRVPSEETRRQEQVLELGRLGSRARFVLFNGHYLACDAGKSGDPRVVNLAYLADTPVRVRQPAWRWLIATLVLAAGAGVTLALAPSKEAALLGGFTVIALLGYLHGVRTRIVFRTRYGGIAVFELNAGLLQRRKADAFASVLQERIDGAARILPGGDQRLAAEIAEHRRMLSEGWLSRARYDLAKKRIFSRYRKIAPRS